MNQETITNSILHLYHLCQAIPHSGEENEDGGSEMYDRGALIEDARREATLAIIKAAGPAGILATELYGFQDSLKVIDSPLYLCGMGKKRLPIGTAYVVGEDAEQPPIKAEPIKLPNDVPGVDWAKTIFKKRGGQYDVRFTWIG